MHAGVGEGGAPGVYHKLHRQRKPAPLKSQHLTSTSARSPQKTGLTVGPGLWWARLPSHPPQSAECLCRD